MLLRSYFQEGEERSGRFFILYIYFFNLTNTAKYYLVQEFSSKREDEHFIQSFHISLENLAASIPLFYITNKIMCVQPPPCL